MGTGAGFEDPDRNWKGVGEGDQERSRRKHLQPGSVHMRLCKSRAATANSAAEQYVHYIHGVNPLGLVYLTNSNALVPRTQQRPCFTLGSPTAVLIGMRFPQIHRAQLQAISWAAPTQVLLWTVAVPRLRERPLITATVLRSTHTAVRITHRRSRNHRRSRICSSIRGGPATPGPLRSQVQAIKRRTFAFSRRLLASERSTELHR